MEKITKKNKITNPEYFLVSILLILKRNTTIGTNATAHKIAFRNTPCEYPILDKINLVTVNAYNSKNHNNNNLVSKSGGFGAKTLFYDLQNILERWKKELPAV